MLEGLVSRRVSVSGASATDVSGPGDLIRPWEDDEFASAPVDALVSVICPTRLAVLDERFATATARWPTFTAELMSRYLFRTRWLLLQLAVSSHRRVDARLLMMLWNVADRYGRVRPEGILLRLPAQARAARAARRSSASFGHLRARRAVAGGARGAGRGGLAAARRGPAGGRRRPPRASPSGDRRSRVGLTARRGVSGRRRAAWRPVSVAPRRVDKRDAVLLRIEGHRDPLEGQDHGRPGARPRRGVRRAGRHRERGRPEPAELALHHVQHGGGAGPHHTRRQGPLCGDEALPLGRRPYARHRGSRGRALPGRRGADRRHRQARVRRTGSLGDPAPAGQATSTWTTAPPAR